MKRPAKAPYTQEDWDEVSDSPELTEADFRKARPGAEVYPNLADAVARRRGRPVSDAPKVQINLRVDPDVLERYRAGGPGWQTRMNAALRAGLVPGVKDRPSDSSRERAEVAKAVKAKR